MYIHVNIQLIIFKTASPSYFEFAIEKNIELCGIYVLTHTHTYIRGVIDK